MNYSYSITETGSGADENAICSGFDIVVFPNPINFERQNLTVNIPYTDKLSTTDKIEFFNIKGQKVNAMQLSHKNIWNGKQNNGRIATSGLYFYKITDKGEIKTGKILVIK